VAFRVKDRHRSRCTSLKVGKGEIGDAVRNIVPLLAEWKAASDAEQKQKGRLRRRKARKVRRARSHDYSQRRRRIQISDQVSTPDLQFAPFVIRASETGTVHARQELGKCAKILPLWPTLRLKRSPWPANSGFLVDRGFHRSIARRAGRNDRDGERLAQLRLTGQPPEIMFYRPAPQAAVATNALNPLAATLPDRW